MEEGPYPIHYFPAIAKAERAQESRRAPERPLALYVHIPFCDALCYFCESAVVAGKRANKVLVDEYLRALRDEIRSFLRTATDGQALIELIQFGGGTPTFLSAQALNDLITFILDHFDCSALQEVIVEGSPISISNDRIAVLERVPKLKLNIGVQSLHYECLASVGRRKHWALAETAIASVMSSNIDSVGVDIIFGLPFSTPATVQSDLEKASELGAEHFALYPLWIYEQTELESRVRSGKLVLPNVRSMREQLFAGTEVLSSRRYSRYTAFHYALGHAARQQYGLWQMSCRDWVGFGMSAMSHLDGSVYFNDTDIHSYIEKVRAGVSVSCKAYQLSAIEQMRFVLLYGLRLDRYPTSLFADRFGIEIDEVFGNELRRLERRGLLTWSSGELALTLDGILALGAIEECINRTSDLMAIQDLPGPAVM